MDAPVIKEPQDVVVAYGSDTSPHSIGAPTISDNSKHPVSWVYVDSSTQTLDSMVCDHSNYEIYRKFVGKDVSGNSAVSDFQIIKVRKPNSLVFKYFPSDTSVTNATNLYPDKMGWHTVKAKIISWYSPKLRYEDKVMDSNESRKIIRRAFTAEGICPADYLRKNQIIVSRTVGLEDDGPMLSLNIFPNPVTDITFIEKINDIRGFKVIMRRALC